MHSLRRGFGAAWNFLPNGLASHIIECIRAVHWEVLDEPHLDLTIPERRSSFTRVTRLLRAGLRYENRIAAIHHAPQPSPMVAMMQ